MLEGHLEEYSNFTKEKFQKILDSNIMMFASFCITK